MRRKTVWTPKPVSSTRSDSIKASELAERRHRHGCTSCSHTYEDRCSDPLTNRLCTTCRDVPYDPPAWEINLAPQECCVAARPVKTTEERVKYLLGGEAEWWICPKCFRPQIYKPDARRINAPKEKSNDRTSE